MFQAIRRLVNRDNLTEEQAKQRVDAQPKNETMVKESNVVFSTQWSYEFSRQQVMPQFSSVHTNSRIFSNFLELIVGTKSMEWTYGTS